MSAHHKFTEGPWHLDVLNENRWILDENDNYLAEIIYEDEEGKIAPEHEQHWNGQLMAHAPEMLEFIQSFVEEYGNRYGDDDALAPPSKQPAFVRAAMELIKSATE